MSKMIRYAFLAENQITCVKHVNRILDKSILVWIVYAVCFDFCFQGLMLEPGNTYT